MEIRSALLNSAVTLNNLMPGQASKPEIARALAAIDRMGNLYDSLKAAQSTVSPHETPEARAMRYERQFKSAVSKAREVALEAAGGLDVLSQVIEAAALGQAGLGESPASGAEIRASLRGMSQDDRDKAIADAFKRGDTEVLASIYGQNRVTWGGTSKPLDQQFQHFIQKAAPEAQAGREAVSKALEGLELATETFVTSAEAWREPEAAARGYQQLEEYDLAEQALKEALSRQL